MKNLHHATDTIWSNSVSSRFAPVCLSRPGSINTISPLAFFIFYKVYRNHLFKLQTTIKCMEMKMLLRLMHDAIRGIKTHSY